MKKILLTIVVLSVALVACGAPESSESSDNETVVPQGADDSGAADSPDTDAPPAEAEDPVTVSDSEQPVADTSDSAADETDETDESRTSSTTSPADILLTYHRNGVVTQHDSYMYEADRTIVTVPGGKEPAMVFTLDSVHQVELGNSLELLAVDMYVLEAGTSVESLAGIEIDFSGNPFGFVPGVAAKNVFLIFFDHESGTIAGTHVLSQWRPRSQTDIVAMEPVEDEANQVTIQNVNFNAGEYTEERTVTWSTASDGDVEQISVSDPRIVPSGDYQGGPPQ